MDLPTTCATTIPFVYPHCGGAMRILAFIEQPELIEKILTHLGLRPAPAHSPPFAGYPLPSAQQRVAPRNQGVRSAEGTRNQPTRPTSQNPQINRFPFPGVSYI